MYKLNNITVFNSLMTGKIKCFPCFHLYSVSFSISFTDSLILFSNTKTVLILLTC